MVKIGLCMIVKNESHIIHESMKCTLPLIDTYVIVDTGSTDNTIQTIKNFYNERNIEGEVHERPWVNFGHNRSEALKLCDGKMDYILVIDADDLMEFPSNGKQILNNIFETIKPSGAIISIKQGTLDYSRAQIFKANDDWKYVGVLHEYPSNGKSTNMINLPKSFWMESRRLGDRNKVDDKGQRDINILLKGLESEPNNERYMFYLAQTYHDTGDYANSLIWYKRRFKIGKWFEEAWYSAYRVGSCYKHLGNIIKFEEWMQRAYKYHSKRSEPLYQLTEYFRSNGQFYKAYQYMLEGRKVEYPKDDVLFIETFPYKGGFDYEASILDYYVNQDKNIGLRSSINYLLKQNMYIQNVISNIVFYVSPISSSISRLNIPDVFGEDFRPSAVSVLEYPFANIRHVNYLKPVDGQYRTKDGGPVQTRNAYINIETGECIAVMDDSTVDIAERRSNVKGLEDIRLFNSDATTKFVATSYDQYIDGVGMIVGDYNVSNKSYKNCKPIVSPFGKTCEKNWLPILDTGLFIYSWNPMRIGSVDTGNFKTLITYETPKLFTIFRGSAPPRLVDDKLWTLIHFVHYGNLRKYYHCFVELDSKTYKPLRVTLPFVFKEASVEYCVSFCVFGDTIECYASFMDGDPSRVTFPSSKLEWLDI